MNSDLPKCDRELLYKALDDSLSDVQEETLACHLSQCSVCQLELERLAADEVEWSRVGDILKQEAEASRSTEGGGATAAFLGSQPPSDDSHLPSLDEQQIASADFAVDFLEPSPTPESLGRLGAIEIHDVIGRGGMGIVLRGFQPELNRPVAVKVLAPHLATSGAARQRFAREARATAVIVHPNVMPILTVDSSGKLPHLVMPYMPCESLQQRLDRGGPLALIDVLRIAMQVANGLAAAHAQGLVHRDIKPANVLLENGVDRALLTDFGLARAVDDASLTRTGVIAGTPQFMSPEQARGDSIDPRSDLFSLGSVMYAMCTGRPPFRAETSYGILRRITDTEPRPIGELCPELPVWLAAVIGTLHAKDPADRFQSAADLAGQLEACVAHVQQPAAVPLPESVRAFARRDPPPTRAQQATSHGRFRWFGQALAKRYVPVAVGVVAGLLVAAFVVGPARWEWGRSDTNRDAAPGAAVRAMEAVPPATESAATSGAPATAWRDDAGRQIIDLTRRVETFEAEAARLWGDPLPTPTLDQPVTPKHDAAATEERPSARSPYPAEISQRTSPKQSSEQESAK